MENLLQFWSEQILFYETAVDLYSAKENVLQNSLDRALFLCEVSLSGFRASVTFVYSKKFYYFIKILFDSDSFQGCQKMY